MAKVLSIDNEFNDGLAVVRLASVNAANIRVVVGDHSGKLLQHPGAVVAVNSHAHREALQMAVLLVRRARPLHVDAAVALVKQILHIRAAARMHRYAFAAGHVANNLFAANRIATSRAIHKQIVLALHFKRV